MDLKIQAVLFDLDGTLTRPWFDFDRIRAEIGIESGSILEAIERMPPDRQERARRILHRWEARGAEASQLNEGVHDLLAWLKQTRRKTALVTRNRRQNVRRVCQLHDLAFDAVVSREDGPAKPDPFGVLHACRLMGVQPDRTLMVGDYVYDLRCGRAAGARAVLITTSDRYGDYLNEADYVIDRFDQLVGVIRQEEARPLPGSGAPQRPASND